MRSAQQRPVVARPVQPPEATTTARVNESMADRSLPDIRNRLVNFKVCDVYLPDPRDILTALHGNDILQGRVLDLSDSGDRQRAFAVVEVEGIDRHVFIAMERILGVL